LDDHLGGLWEFPGGKVEKDETFVACLEREIREELGIEIGVGSELGDITHSYPEKTVHLKFFRCELRAGVAQPIHCHALAWVQREELMAFEFPAADAKLLRQLEENPDLWRGDAAPVARMPS
jgi:mutator protein MutT